MIRHRHIDALCTAAILLALLLTGLFACGSAFGIQRASAAPGYADCLFNNSRVHTVDLRVEDWGTFLHNAPSEAYIPCTAVMMGRNFSRWACAPRGTTPCG